MRTGRSLVDLATELQRQMDSKADYITDTRNAAIAVTPDKDVRLVLAHETGDEVFTGITPTAHRQIGTKVGIPAKYYDRMLASDPRLLATNVNHWFDNEPERRMLRTLDGNVRAFLSDRYKRIDNYDVAEVVIPKLTEANAEIVSAEVTDTRMYLKAVNPALRAEIGPPSGWEWGRGHDLVHVVEAGIVITNSEVGMSALNIEPAIHTRHCTNLAVWGAKSTRKLHLGSRLTLEGDEMWKILSDETRTETARVLMAQIGDIVASAINGAIFREIVDELQAARENRIEGNPAKAVEKLADGRLTNDEAGGVLNHLINGGELTQYALHAAVTRMSQSNEITYDRATELEHLGAEIIQLPASEWETIAKAA